jgi:thioesterase domain-containing protein/acyl carrier protein
VTTPSFDPRTAPFLHSCSSERLDERHGGTFSLTAPQMAIWLDQALHRGKPIYNTGQIITISAALDTQRFAQALRDATAENDALRLRFHQNGPQIVQEIADVAAHDMEFQDFSDRAGAGAAARAWLNTVFWQPISPTDFPLFQFALAKVSAHRFLWLQKYHHLITDAVGRQLIASRVAEIYEALSRPDSLPQRDVGTYALARSMEDEYLASDQYAADEAYWKQRFDPLPRMMVRAAATASEKLRSGRPARIICGMTLDESNALRAFARSRGSSVFQLMVATAWCCFSRLYHDTDLVFGVPLARRPNDAARRTVGLFATVMPFRVSLDPSVSLGVALAKLNQDLSEDLVHQRFPADHINRLLQLRRLGRGGLYDVAINYVRNDYAFSFSGTPVSCENLSAGFAVPWSIMALEYGAAERIHVLLDYDLGRVEESTATYLAASFQNLLRDIVRLAEVPIGRLAARVQPGSANLVQPTEPNESTAAPPHLKSAIGSERTAPRDVIESALVGIWEQYLDTRKIDIHDDYFELGGDSLKAVLVIGECSERFGVELPLAMLFQYRTIEQLANAIRVRTEGPFTTIASSSCIVHFKDGMGGAPLLLVHPVGGTVFCYRELAKALPDSCPVYAAQTRGLWTSDDLPQSIESMAREYLEAAARAIPNGRIHLAGWSFGGLVAFEMAHLLARAGRPAMSLTLIDTPLTMPAEEPASAETAQRLAAAAFGVDAQALTGTNITQSISAAIASLPGIPPPAKGQMERMVAVVNNAQRLRARYRPKLLGQPVTLLRAASEPGSFDANFAWGNYIRGPLRIVALPTTHDGLMRQPFVRTVATVLADAMAEEITE